MGGNISCSVLSLEPRGLVSIGHPYLIEEEPGLDTRDLNRLPPPIGTGKDEDADLPRDTTKP